MKFSYNWLKDFVDCALSPQDLGERLTMSGLEVKDISVQGEDYVFEAEITSNRPDWLSVRGIAREVAALTGKNFKERAARRHPCVDSIPLRSGARSCAVHVADTKDCPLYTGRVIKGVTMRPSPDWLRSRLEMLGCRSSNAIVDVTNYIMFEYGTPLHAFDLSSLSGAAVAVRRAAPRETIVTLDGTRRQLNAEMLVIADAKSPIALAGIMGGKDTEVSDATHAILLEAAVFNPVITRKTRQALGLMSESAYRFERGVDPGIVPAAAQAAAMMIMEICGGTCEASFKAGSAAPRPVRVRLDPHSVAAMLGTAVPARDIKRILTSLGFSVAARGDRMTVTVPSFRGDVAIPADLIEEISRIYGYDRIPATVPIVRAPVEYSDGNVVAATRRIVAALGLTEVITYSTVSRHKAQDYPRQLRAGEELELVNPAIGDETLLRQTLIPSLVDRVAHNLNQGQEYVSLFEVARVYARAKNAPRETLKLGICLCGMRQLFLANGTVKDKATVSHVKGIIETLAQRCGVAGIAFAPGPDGCSFVVSIGGVDLGTMGKVPDAASDAAKIKNRDVFYAEIDMEIFALHAVRARRYSPLPKFPGIIRDISCALKQGQDIQAVLVAVQETAGQYLKRARVTDYYAGKQIAPGYRGITLSCAYRRDDRTLTEEDIEPLHAKVCAVLASKFNAIMR
jgi:phenylalanyl-tRNA synthetase beta chain